MNRQVKHNLNMCFYYKLFTLHWNRWNWSLLLSK